MCGKPNMWADSLQHRRCVVPSYGFYEPHRTDTHPSSKTGKPIKDQAEPLDERHPPPDAGGVAAGRD